MQDIKPFLTTHQKISYLTVSNFLLLNFPLDHFKGPGMSTIVKGMKLQPHKRLSGFPTNGKKPLPIEYILTLFISECFHKVLTAYNMSYNVTRNIQLVIKFITGIQQRTDIDIEVMMIGSIYFSRICDKLHLDQCLDLEFISSRKIWLSCLITATKYHNEANHSLLVWSKLTGLNTSELNLYERFTLKTLDYNLNFDEHDIQSIKSVLYSRSYSNCLKTIDILNQYNESNTIKYSKVIKSHIHTTHRDKSVLIDDHLTQQLTTPPSSPSLMPAPITHHQSTPIPRSNSVNYIDDSNDEKHNIEPATLITEKARSYYELIIDHKVYATTFDDN